MNTNLYQDQELALDMMDPTTTFQYNKPSHIANNHKILKSMNIVFNNRLANGIFQAATMPILQASNVLLRHSASKVAFMMLLCLMGIGSLHAQNPGGITGEAYWLRADDIPYAEGTIINNTNTWPAKTGAPMGTIVPPVVPTGSTPTKF